MVFDEVPLDKIALERIGPSPLLNATEEKNIIDHLTFMSSLGYDYTTVEISKMATDYAVYVEKRLPTEGELSRQWYKKFRSRWPEVKSQKPQKLDIIRAKSTCKEVVDTYYSELKSLLDTYGLLGKPENIYILEEITLPMGESAEDDLVNEQIDGRSVDKNKRFTVIVCGSASGSLVPPYLILPGQSWNEEFIKNTCQGTGGECAENGMCHSLIMKNYFQTHFKKFVATGGQNPPIMVLYDGHKSQLMLPFKSWAEENNIIFYVIPPHCSTITHWDNDCFHSLKELYRTECLSYLRRKECLSLSNYDCGTVVSTAYLKAMTESTMTKFFSRKGIVPFSQSVFEFHWQWYYNE